MVRTPPGRFAQYCLDIKGIVVVNFLVRVIIFCCILSSRSVAPNKNSGLDS